MEVVFHRSPDITASLNIWMYPLTDLRPSRSDLLGMQICLAVLGEQYCLCAPSCLVPNLEAADAVGCGCRPVCRRSDDVEIYFAAFELDRGHPSSPEPRRVISLDVRPIEKVV